MMTVRFFRARLKADYANALFNYFYLFLRFEMIGVPISLLRH